jgi:hypothetical protein
MTRITSILAAAVFAAFSMSALAADDAAKAARKQANDTYKADKKNCDGMKGKEKSACRKEAKAKYDQALASAKNDRKANKAERKAEKKGGMAPSSSAPSTAPAPTTK